MFDAAEAADIRPRVWFPAVSKLATMVNVRRALFSPVVQRGTERLDCQESLPLSAPGDLFPRRNQVGMLKDPEAQCTGEVQKSGTNMSPTGRWL